MLLQTKQNRPTKSRKSFMVSTAFIWATPISIFFCFLFWKFGALTIPAALGVPSLLVFLYCYLRQQLFSRLVANHTKVSRDPLVQLFSSGLIGSRYEYERTRISR